MNNNVDVSKLLAALSKMSKEDLEAGIAKANQILKNTDKKDLLNNFNQNSK